MQRYFSDDVVAGRGGGSGTSAALPAATVARGQLVTSCRHAESRPRSGGLKGGHGSGSDDLLTDSWDARPRRQVDSCEKSLGGRDGDHFADTHELRPGPHLAEIVVPTETVTDSR